VALSVRASLRRPLRLKAREAVLSDSPSTLSSAWTIATWRLWPIRSRRSFRPVTAAGSAASVPTASARSAAPASASSAVSTEAVSSASAVVQAPTGTSVSAG
jgi:hypothetical protein